MLEKNSAAPLYFKEAGLPNADPQYPEEKKQPYQKEK